MLTPSAVRGTFVGAATGTTAAGSGTLGAAGSLAGGCVPIEAAASTSALNAGSLIYLGSFIASSGVLPDTGSATSSMISMYFLNNESMMCPLS